MSRYAGKSVIVTGAGQGIGAAYARAFAAEGASVVVADIDGALAETTAREIPGALACAVDVTDDAGVERMAQRAAEAFGGIDVLGNNAGLHLGKYNGTTGLAHDDWRRLFDVNVFGPVVCARACRPHLAARGGGVILNQSSSSAWGGNGAYAVSKLALNGVTLSLAQELAADSIRVLGIAPGMIASDAVLERLEEHHKRFVLDRQLVKRFGRLEDLIGMVLLLCSEQASLMSGETVLVDGGFVRRI